MAFPSTQSIVEVYVKKEYLYDLQKVPENSHSDMG